MQKKTIFENSFCLLFFFFGETAFFNFLHFCETENKFSKKVKKYKLFFLMQKTKFENRKEKTENIFFSMKKETKNNSFLGPIPFHSKLIFI